MALFKLSLKLKNHLEDLNKLNKALELFSRQLGMAEKCACETNLVLEELFTNIIKHGCCDGGPHTVHITIALEEDTLVMHIEDDGIPFNPLAVETPPCNVPPEKRRIGGLGILLARHYTENIQYRRSGKKNILKLIKKLILKPNRERSNGNN